MMIDIGDKDKVDRWLDPGFDRTKAFEDLLVPRLVTGLEAVPIDRPSRRNTAGDVRLLQADEKINTQ